MTGFKKFSDFAQSKKAVLNIEAINYSDGGASLAEEMNIKTLPEIRLYVGPGNF